MTNPSEHPDEALLKARAKIADDEPPSPAPPQAEVGR